MIDVRGEVVTIGDNVALIERVTNIARYRFGKIVEISDNLMQIKVQYDDGKVSPWRGVYFHGIKHPNYNKLLKVD